MLRTAILVAIGANLPSADGRSPLETCQWAAHALPLATGLDLDAVSRWFVTRPVPISDQPSFINGVALLSGVAEPDDLLQALQALEASAGRVRGIANSARTLDLDLLAMDDLVFESRRLTIPHPRLHERAFVLAPLCDVLPDWRHPVLGLTASTLLARVAGQGIQAM